MRRVSAPDPVSKMNKWVMTLEVRLSSHVGAGQTGSPGRASAVISTCRDYQREGYALQKGENLQKSKREGKSLEEHSRKSQEEKSGGGSITAEDGDTNRKWGEGPQTAGLDSSGSGEGGRTPFNFLPPHPSSQPSSLLPCNKHGY